MGADASAHCILGIAHTAWSFPVGFQLRVRFGREKQDACNTGLVSNPPGNNKGATGSIVNTEK